jgi:hypothetical protein
MIEIILWNKIRPNTFRVVETTTADEAGVFLSGAIQAAIDSNGTLVIEVREK